MSIKVYQDCSECDGTGRVLRTMQRGFFTYQAGARCPECEQRWQRELAAMAGQGQTVTIRSDGIEARLKRLEDAVFGNSK